MCDKIHIAGLVRKLLKRKKDLEELSHWQVVGKKIKQVDKNGSPVDAAHTFDRAFSLIETNLDVYHELCRPIVFSVMEGFNGTIFAYGQTSSGKTYTILGDGNDPGIILSSIAEIFEYIENTPHRDFLLHLSYMEIYNEQLCDLLCKKPTNLKVMENFIVESRPVGAGPNDAVMVSHLNLVDLSGSQPTARMGSTGDRRREGININLSLLTLRQVICKLSEGDSYVNFRDSKLTRMLQNSLGGNAKTAIICTVTPASIEGTRSTLNMADSTCVRVAVRCRPLSKKEQEDGVQPALNFTSGEPQIVVKDADKAFTYDYVFTPNSTQEQVYSGCVSHLVQNVFQGYNATVLAYGQTGSGKTHTMGTAGPIDGGGIIQRAVADIFSSVQQNQDKRIHIKATFLEIYKEEIFDLLAETRSKDVVTIREDFNGVKLCGMLEIDVSSAQEVFDLLEKASLRRQTASTNMNACSSRSHAVFTLNIHQDKTMAKFHLVDLAGSERAKRTGAQGERLREGININLGLLSLGNVISALCDRKHHIPYRDSKLTRLLQDSLGGNSHTVMIACISFADVNLEETLNTLRYADRARKIQNKPIVNVDPKSQEIDFLRQSIAKLEERWQLHMRSCALRQKAISFHSSVITRNETVETGEHKIIDDNPDVPVSKLENVDEDDEFSPSNSSGDEGLSNSDMMLELDEINRVLAVKEQHLTEVSNNQEHLEEFRLQYEERIRDLTHEIELLNTEKNNLQAAVNAPNNASKVSEDRRKRIQMLEQKISELSKDLQCKQRMLRVKEEVEKKSKILQSEIMDLKKSRVRLMKQMQKDAHRFKQLEMQMKKKEMHADAIEMRSKRQLQKSSNEKAVLQRKLTEAQNAKRRLEHALEKQQRARGRVQHKTLSVAEIQQWISNELNVEVHKEEAKRHLEHLKEDRALLSRQLRQLDENDQPSPPKMAKDDSTEESKQDEVDRLKKDLHERTHQISDLHEKLFHAESDPKQRFSSVFKLDEARTYLNELFEMLVTNKTRVISLERKVSEVEAENAELVANLQKQRKQHTVELQKERLASDEKILYLMQQTIKTTTHQDEDNEELEDFKSNEISRLGYLNDELQRKSEQCEKLQDVLALSVAKNKLQRKKMEECESYEVETASDLELSVSSNSENDPDWVKTPLLKRNKRKIAVQESSEEGETKKENGKNMKRISSSLLCKCRGRCSTKICGCQKNGRTCTDSCQCSIDNCENRNKENSEPPNDSGDNFDTTFVVPKSRILAVKNKEEELAQTRMTEGIYKLQKRRTIYTPANDSFFGSS